MSTQARPIFRYKDTSWLDSLPAYNLNEGVDQQLDMLRKIIKSASYVWKGLAFPNIPNDIVAARDSFNGNLSVLPGTYLTMITGYASSRVVQQQTIAPGFMLQIYDEGAQTYIYNGLFGKDAASTGSMALDAVTPAGSPFGPFIFPSPVVVLAPGRLNIEVTNLDNAAMRIQILICCAVPISNVSFGVPQSIEGSGG